MSTEIKQFITDKSYDLSRSIVATPASRQHLESFAGANSGSADLILMQMAIQFGYKIALEDIEEELNK